MTHFVYYDTLDILSRNMVSNALYKNTTESVFNEEGARS